MDERNRRKCFRMAVLARLARERHRIGARRHVPGMEWDSSAQCRPGDKCRERFVAASLDKGQVSILKYATIPQLGRHSGGDPVEQRGNPVASPLARGYLANAQEKLRRGGVSVKQAPPQVMSQ